MEQAATSPLTQATASRGRPWFWLGAGVFVLGLAAYIVQLRMKILTVPWYTPVLATVGVLMMLVAVWRRPTIIRIIGLVFFAVLGLGEWWFMLSLSRLPDYAGPIKPGTALPAFRAVRADGTTLTERELRDGTPTVMLFFRGRW
jgi:hypothetical protein